MPEARILKQSPARTVVVVGDRVEKRFRHPKVLSRLWDRGRARREFETLARLEAAGIPVPRPCGVRRDADGWTVEMEWLRDARPLSAWLEEPDVPFDRARLARELGRLLARLHGIGLDHPDLHPGNVLASSAGEVWAIDFHKAEFSSPTPERRTRDLVALASSVRERTSPHFRARAYWSWRRELGETSSLPSPSLHAREIELEARRHRFRVVYERRLRWLRESSSCRSSHVNGWQTFSRRQLTDTHLRRLSAEVPLKSPPSLDLVTVDGRALVRVAGRPARVIDTWFGAARMAEHGLGVHPHALFLGETACAFCTSPFHEPGREWEPNRVARALHERGIHSVDVEVLRSTHGVLSNELLGVP